MHPNQTETPRMGRHFLGRGVPIGVVLLAVLALQGLIVWAGIVVFRAF